MSTRTVLTVDVGNTQTKALLFGPDGPVGKLLSGPSDPEFIEHLCADQSQVALASVVKMDRILEDRLRDLGVLVVSATTPTPLTSSYTTPNTLGTDRLCAAVAGHRSHPDYDVLVIDLGTCITYDVITAAGVHIGGAISPGMRMRFKALAEQTSKLPLVDAQDVVEITGTDTASCIRSGVIHGITFELSAAIEHYQQCFTGLKTVVTGGDATRFVSGIKSPIFADPFLVLRGLYEIHHFQHQAV